MRKLASSLFLLALLGLAVPAVSRAAGGPDSQVASLLAASRAALGGAALERGGVMQLSGTASIGGLSGTGTQWIEVLGRRFAEHYTLPPVSGGDGYDGTVTWSLDGSGVVWVDGSTAGRSSEIVQAYLADYTLWAPNSGGAKVVWGGEKTLKGVAYDTLLVTPPGSAVPCELWFDRTTHLPVRAVQTIGPNVTTQTFADYRRARGIMFPYKVTTVGSDGNTTDSTTTSAVAAPTGAARLVKPASNVHDYSIAGGATQTTIPFEFIGGHVYLNVMLNGKGPYHFVYDTGGSNLIDPAVAQEIGAIGHGSIQGGGVGETTESVAFAKVATLQFGDATVKDQLFGILPIRAGFGGTMGTGTDGLIGFEVLSRFVTTFDYGNRRLTFTLPQAAKNPAGSKVVPFVFSGQQPQFPCTIDAIATQCTVDTGARDSITLFSPFVAAHPEVVPQQISAVGVNGYGVGGPALGRLGRLRTLGIGPFTLSDVVADFSTQQKGAFAAPYIAANIGGSLWQKFSLTLDYGKQTMALLPNASFDQQDAYERAGLFLLSRGGKIVVADVRPGTPAAQAGIVKDDTIAIVDGKPASSMSVQDVRNLFGSPAGTVVQLGIVEKDGTQRTVPLTLRDFI